MNFNIIVAVDVKNGISKNGLIPWKISNDLKYFKKITTFTSLPSKENAVIMGRKTADSLPNKFLSNRFNVVLTHSVTYKNENAIIVNDFNKALIECQNKKVDTVWVIGGREVYNLAFNHPLLKKIYITIINKDYDCDNIISLPSFEIIDSVSSAEKDENSQQSFNVLNLIAKPIYTAEQKYLSLLNQILREGSKRMTRNAVTLSLFNREISFNVSKNFPLLTTKKMFWKGIVEELLFFIRGETNTKILEEKKINIWKGNTNTEFLNKLNLNYEEGNMGPMYGYQWRFFNKPIDDETGGIDQLKNLIELIKNDPHSRRLLMTDFNPSQVDQGVLYPCHSLILQFYVEDKSLSVKMYQRSADVFLGLPFNIASTSLLLYIIAKLSNLEPNNVSISLGDTHIYEDHLEAVKEQLSRNCLELPKLEIPDFKNLEEVETSTFQDYKIIDYVSGSSIKAVMIA